MGIRFFKLAAMSCAVFISGCSIQAEEKIALDISQDAQTALSFKGQAYGLSHSEIDKLQAIADEMAESFYWHSRPEPPLPALSDGRELAWTLRKPSAGQPSPVYETKSVEQLKARISDMYAGFEAYQSAYLEAHPDYSEPVRCSADWELCDQYVDESLQNEIRNLRNVYIAEVLDTQLGGLGEVELTSDEPETQIHKTDKEFVLVVGEYQVESLSEQSAETLFNGGTFMVGPSSLPCLYLVDVSDTKAAEMRTLNAGNTAFCGIKLYSGFSGVAEYLGNQL